MSNTPLAVCFRDLFEEIDKKISRSKPLIAAASEMTYGTVVERIKRLSGVYQTMGLVPGDRLIISSRNDLDVVVFFLSLLRCGIAAVVVDPETKPLRLKRIIEKSEAKAAAVDTELRKAWFSENEPIPIIEIRKQDVGKKVLLKKLLQPKTVETEDNAYPSMLENFPPLDKVDEFDNELDAYILFTSGTTSEPKGVRISHRNLFAHLATLSRQFDYSPDSRILNVLPLDHTDGLVQGPMVAFFNGATVYRPLRFSIQNLGRLLDSVYTHRITHFVAVPTILSLIHKLGSGYEDSFSTSDFRFVISAAAYLEPALWESFESRFKTRVANVYGLTETVTGGLFSGPTDADHKIGTVGKPVDCEVKIVDEHHNPVPVGTVGEILLRGENVMKGYVNAEEETDKVLKDGWLYTGDLGSMDGEGFVRIVGRKKSIIKSGGMNISPNEITEIVNLHPHILDATTIGMPDESWGEIAVTCVVDKPGTKVTQTDLIEFIRDHLEPYKIPARIYSVPELPKGPSGKILTEKLRETVQQLMQGPAMAATSDLQTAVMQTAAKCFQTSMDSLNIHSGPADLTGWDSLAHLEFVLALEERFKIKLSTSEIMRIERLKDAETIVFSKLNA